MAEDPRKKSRPDRSKAEAKLRGSVLRQSSVPGPSGASLEILEDLIFYWLILGPEVAEERISRLLRYQGADPVTVGAIVTFAEHYSGLLRPGFLHRELLDAWDRRNDDDVRQVAVEKIVKKAPNPVYRPKWKAYEERITRELFRRYDELPIKDAVKYEVATILHSPANKEDAAPGIEGGIGMLQYFIQDLPHSEKEALMKLKNEIEIVLLNDLLGSNFRSKKKAISISEVVEDGEAKDVTIEDMLPDTESLSPEEEAELSEEDEVLEKLISKANSSGKTRLTPSEEKIFRLIYSEHTTEEVAKVMGIKAGVVYVHLCNARNKMKKVYVPPDP